MVFVYFFVYFFIQILYRLLSDFLGYEIIEIIGNKIITYAFQLTFVLMFGLKRNSMYE